MKQQQELRVNTEQYLNAGGRLDDPMTAIPQFDAALLAQAIYIEIANAMTKGQTHIKINMDLVDAKAMADFLQNKGR